MNRTMKSVYRFCILPMSMNAALFIANVQSQQLPKPGPSPTPVIIGETPDTIGTPGPSVLTQNSANQNSTLPGHVLPRPSSGTGSPASSATSGENDLPRGIPTPPTDLPTPATQMPRPATDRAASYPQTPGDDQQRRPSLGMVAQERLDRTGLSVIEVRGGSPAQLAGLQAGDILTRFNGRETQSIDDVSLVLKSLTIGDSAALEVKRGGKLYELHCKLIDQPTDMPASLSNDGDSSATIPSPAISSPAFAGNPGSQHGILGITVEDSQGYPTDGQVLRGARVVSVASGSPADQAGIQSGDILVSINGNVMYGARELTQYMLTSQPGQTVEVGFYQGGVLHRSNTTLTGASSATGMPTPIDDSDRPNVGRILEGVGRTLDGILGPDRPRLLQPSVVPSNPMTPNSGSSLGSIPTPRTIPSPPALQTPVDELSAAGSRSSSSSSSTVRSKTRSTTSETDSNAALRKQLEQLRMQMQAIESKLQDGSSDPAAD